MKSITQATVVFLQDGDGKICLAQKKKPIHHEDGEISYSLGTWNGYGGKREKEDANIEQTAIRELAQESGAVGEEKDLVLCGHVHFFWPNNESDVADMEVYFYFLRVWRGNLVEGDEMGAPQFFTREGIPYDEMMGGDKIIFPKMIDGEFVKGSIYFGKTDEKGLPLFVEGE